MSQLQEAPRSSSGEMTIVSRIMDVYARHARENPGKSPTTAYIPLWIERQLEAYYQLTHGRGAREMVPRWAHIQCVVWEAREFKVC